VSVAPAQTIIIVRKKKGHGGHHGGAWKVAYADFVTAMMALFIVLWLLASDDKVKKAVGGYFQDPTGRGKLQGTILGSNGAGPTVSKEDMTKLKEHIEQALKEMPAFEKIKDHIELTVTNEGLRIELLENEQGMFFESGKPMPTDSGSKLLALLAGELAKIPNKLLIEGHTDAKPYAGGGTYSNWELSADRANAARRIMQVAGLPGDRVAQVRGFADQHLRAKDRPEDTANRRVTVIVQYRDPPLEAIMGASAASQALHKQGQAR
jgi:chemotaxis protein MotB